MPVGIVRADLETAILGGEAAEEEGVEEVLEPWCVTLRTNKAMLTTTKALAWM